MMAAKIIGLIRQPFKQQAKIHFGDNIRERAKEIQPFTVIYLLTLTALRYLVVVVVVLSGSISFDMI